MQTCLLTLGIFLAGQVSDSSGNRYPAVNPATPAAAGLTEISQQPVGQGPWAVESTNIPPAEGNQLRTNIPPKAEPPARTQLPLEPPARTSPVTPPASSSPPVGLTKVTQAADLLRSLANPVGYEKLGGVPLSLAEAVQNAASRTEQTQRVKLYWDLSQAVTNYHLESLEQLELQSLRSGIAQAGQAWAAAQQAGAARKGVASSAVSVAQLRLQQELGRSEDRDLPLPSDLPHCGAYQTKYQQIFSKRSSSEAKQLSDLLPVQHEEINQWADASVAARDWLVLVSKQRTPRDDGTELLKAYENLALQRRAFVSSAYQYNANIARYTELAVPQEIDAVRLVTMLIQTDGSSGNGLPEGSIRRTSAEEAVPQSDGQRYPERTFVGGRRNEVRRPPASERQGERSILVKPR